MANGKAGFTKPWGVDDGNLDNEGDRTSALSLGGKPVCRPFYSKAVLRRTYLLPAISVLSPRQEPGAEEAKLKPPSRMRLSRDGLGLPVPASLRRPLTGGTLP